MKLFVYLGLLISLNGCATWASFLGLLTNAANKTIQRANTKVNDVTSPYTKTWVEECKRNWIGIKKCEQVVRWVRKDGLPLTAREEEELNSR